MFKESGIFDAAERAARREIHPLGAYVGIIEMEVGCMIDMINQHAIPSAKAAGIDTAGMAAGVSKLEAALKEMHAASDEYEAAKLARVLRLDTMVEVRKVKLTTWRLSAPQTSGPSPPTRNSCLSTRASLLQTGK